MRFTSSGSRVGNWREYTVKTMRATAKCTRMTHREVVSLALCIGAFGDDGDTPRNVPREDDLDGRDLVLPSELDDRGVIADGSVP